MRRAEYPRPQFVRHGWECLNGVWAFGFDEENRGLAECWYKEDEKLPMQIEVPFVYQCSDSGIGDVTPHDIVWYQRLVEIKDWKEGDRVLLHFGAVDYEAKVYVEDTLVGEHIGGNTPFTLDITDAIRKDGMPSRLTVRAYDPHRDETIPRGKQYWKDHSESIWYTNSTGIWQSVWYEVVAATRLERVEFTPLFDEGMVRICATGVEVAPEDTLEYEITYGDETVVTGSVHWTVPELTFAVDLVQNHIFRTGFHHDERVWTPEHPNLYDVRLQVVKNGRTCDEVFSYFGMRKVHTEDGMVYLNNRPYYQKLVLDQGYWPTGLLTAPSDEAFRTDIQMCKDMGFNGCRKHQKMEDPRFLYWADKMGYLVWGECAAAPMYHADMVQRSVQEWTEVIRRDYNHPCIITWVPLNESWSVPHIGRNRMQQHYSQTMYHLIHSLDETRLVISNDGWEMTETDICAIHNYRHGAPGDAQEAADYEAMLADAEALIASRPAGKRIFAQGFDWQGQPILLTEFGGIGYDVSGEPGWGYTSVTNADTYVSEYRRLLTAIAASTGLAGFCYTQICDVEQEINGLLTYDRKPKAALEKIRECNELIRK